MIRYVYFALFLIFVVVGCRNNRPELYIDFIDATSPEDIFEITDTIVDPIVYSNSVSLEDLEINSRKKTFISMVLPSILIVRYQLEQDLKKVELIALKDSTRLDKHERAFIDSLYVHYKTDNLKTLQERLYPHPASLALAQAAIESAWGTSRFYKDANNLFGIWSFNMDEPRIQANGLREGTPVYLRSYANIYESVHGYYYTIATGPYEKFRKFRMNSQNVYKLAHYLDRYSENNQDYIDQLINVIRVNDLTKFDHYHLNPDYVNRN